MTDASTKLGLALGDGYNLSEALEAAFSIAGINKVTCIPISNDKALAKEAYLGNAALGTGIYYQKKRQRASRPKIFTLERIRRKEKENGDRELRI